MIWLGDSNIHISLSEGLIEAVCLRGCLKGISLFCYGFLVMVLEEKESIYFILGFSIGT